MNQVSGLLRRRARRSSTLPRPGLWHGRGKRYVRRQATPRAYLISRRRPGHLPPLRSPIGMTSTDDTHCREACPEAPRGAAATRSPRGRRLRKRTAFSVSTEIGTLPRRVRLGLLQSPVTSRASITTAGAGWPYPEPLPVGTDVCRKRPWHRFPNLPPSQGSVRLSLRVPSNSHIMVAAH